MTYSLPVRHRPRRFAEVTGQQAAVDVLSASAAASRVPQQFLLAGPSGVGKTTLARVFAAALFCAHTTQRPVGTITGADACGECDSCRDVVGPGGRHPDVIEIDAASYGGVDQIRALAEQAHLAPLVAARRVYVIDEAHGLTRDGGQAFLKLLEEPPPHTLFLLATTDPQKLPTALRGRCVQVYVDAPTAAELVANLRRVADAEGWAFDDGVLELVVAASDPDLGVRGTVTTLEKVAAIAGTGAGVSAATVAGMLGVADPERADELTGCIRVGDRAGALAALAAVGGTSEPLLRTQLARWSHEQLRAAVHAGADESLALWWLEQVSDPAPWPLPVRVARMCDPGLGGADGLAALVARAQEVADELAGLTTNPAAHHRHHTPPSRPQPAVPAAGAVPDEGEAGPVAAGAAEVAAPSPSPVGSASVPVPVPVPEGTDADRLLLVNKVGRVGGAFALAVRRGEIVFGPDAVEVYAADPDGRVAAAVQTAAVELGWPVRFHCR